MTEQVNEKNREKQMILKDNLWKVMFQLSWPAVIAMVLYGLNTVFDAIFVGQFVGETALAGVSLAYPLSQLTLGLGSLIGVGAGSALSIAIGANNKDIQHKILPNLNVLTVIISLVYMALAWFLAEPLVKVMGGYGEPLAFGVEYFRITALGTIFWVYGLAGNMVVRAEGRMKKAALMMAGGLVVNVIANYIFIKILGMGVAGAAWGTNLGMAVYTVVGMVYFKSGKASFEARPFSFSKDSKVLKSIISMGMPSLIMSVMGFVQAIIVFNAISRYGTQSDIAFYGAAYRIFTLLLTPIFGLMRAFQPVVGINYGANQNDRVIKGFKIFAAASTILIAPFWIFMMISPQLALSTMMPNKIFSAFDLNNFRIFICSLPLLPIMFMSMTFFPAINNSKPASILGIARQLVFYVPVMLILPRLFGIHWVYLGSMLIDVTVIFIVFILVTLEFKKLRKNKL